MTKYAILYSNYNIYHAEFDTYEEAKEYYDELVKDEGTDFDLQLCKILEMHEAPERGYEPLTNGGHWNIDTSKVEIKKLDTKEFLDPVYSRWFNRGRY